MFPKSPGHYNFSDNDAIAMMVHIREILERSKNKDKFPILNLYCNWTVHTEIEGSTPGYRILARITDILMNSNDPNIWDHQISQELSSAILRQELITLFSENRISTHIFDSAATWTMFGQHFFKAILNKKLRYPQNPAIKTIYNGVVDKAGSRMGEIAISIKLQSDVSGTDNRIFWIVERFNGQLVRGLYLNLEKDPDFSNPSFWNEKVAYIKEPL
jgi:hypothetical protein